MPKKLFHEIDNIKKEKIMNVGIEEFANNDYTNASTNRIVAKSGISKGSLFKYFFNKEDLYFYLLDYVTRELMAEIEKQYKKFPQDIFQKILCYSEVEFNWYISNPQKYSFIVRAFSKNNNEIYEKVAKRYHNEENAIFNNFISEMDSEQFRQDKQITTNILKWLLKGFNTEFIEKVKQEDNKDTNLVKKEYIEKLSEYLKVCREGI